MTQRALRTRWHLLTIGKRRWRWRAGLMRGEWWIGARRDFPSDTWIVGVFGLVVVIGREW